MAGIAARLRNQSHPSQALHLSTRVLGYASSNQQALQTELASLSDLGAPDDAYLLSQNETAGLPADVRRRLRADQASTAIRRAINKRQHLDGQDRYGQRNQVLKKALGQVNMDLALFPKDSPSYQRSQYDRIYALRQLGRSKAAVHAFQALSAKQRQNAPAYVREAAADADLDQDACGTAGPMYARLLASQNNPDAALLIARYYSLIDCNDYSQAKSVLQRLVTTTPFWRYVIQGQGKRHPNWQRLEVDQLQVLDAHYRNHQQAAEKQAFHLYHAAPGNVGLINLAARTLRWRGLPDHADQLTQQAAAYEPRNQSLRFNEAKIARDRGHYATWRHKIKRLAAQFPHDNHIHNSQLAIRDRRQPSVRFESSYGSSSGNTGSPGSKDFQLTARANSPWTTNGFRAFAVQSDQYANYGSFSARMWRPGLGVEWSWGRKHASALVSDGVYKSSAGVRLNWSQWLSDRWQYGFTVDTAAPETPLRANHAGLTGQLYGGHLTWQQNESRSARLDFSELHISDGNLRSSVSVQFSQRLHANAHHKTRLSLDAGFENNTANNAAYYNPVQSGSVAATLHHTWLTWQHYNQAFRQKFKISAGSDFESGYGASAAYSAQYGQQWNLSRTWSLHYAVGYGSHVYDGNREGRVYGVFGFSGTF